MLSQTKDQTAAAAAAAAAKSLQSGPTLCDPIVSSPPVSSVPGILQARILEWVTIAFSRGIFPTQGSNPGPLHWECRVLATGSLGKSQDMDFYFK